MTDPLTIQYQAIFDKWYSPIFWFAYNLVRDHGTADDIAQEVFIRLWKAGAKVIEAQRPNEWLFLIARNETLDRLRKRAKHRFSEDGIYDLRNEESSPLESIFFGRLMELGEGLPKECRKVFIALYIDNLTTGEAAEKLHVTIQTVRNQKTILIGKLRAKLLKEL